MEIDNLILYFTDKQSPAFWKSEEVTEEKNGQNENADIKFSAHDAFL